MTTAPINNIEAELFPLGWFTLPPTDKGMDKPTEVLWFSRLQYATQLAAEFPASVWTERVQKIRDYICRANLALARTLARKSVPDERNPKWDGAYSTALLALARAVDRYQLQRGFRFSTFAYGVIAKELTREWKREKRAGRVRGGFDPALFGREDEQHVDDTDQLGFAMKTAGLSENEKTVLHRRFVEGARMKQIGEELSPPLTKSRVQQIIWAALAKMQTVLELPINKGKAAKRLKRS